MSGILPPQWPLVSTEDGTFTQPWYGYFKSADETWRIKVEKASSLISLSFITNSGIAMLESVPGTTRTLEAPEIGCRKTICVVSTSTTARVTLASTAHLFRNQSTVAGSTGWRLNFGSSAPYKAVELLGISTSEYLIVSNIGAATVTTN
jgi:hypothetical protein